MRNKNLLTMNLQFFAEGEVEDAEVAETVEQPEGEEAEAEEVEDTGDTEEPAEPQFQSDEANAAFARMRRENEALRRQQVEIDAMYASAYGGYTNPETGQPIQSARDYAEAMAAQERMQMRQKLQENNIDPRVIDNMIANSPAVRQAQKATAELNSIRAKQLLEEDFNKVLKFDSSKSTQEDILNDPSYNAVVSYVETHPGMRFDEAYKLVNFDRLASLRGAAAKQAAINQVKSKNHLSTGTSVEVDNGQEDIPANLVSKFKEWFPEKSMKELKGLYNKTLGR